MNEKIKRFDRQTTTKRRCRNSNKKTLMGLMKVTQKIIQTIERVSSKNYFHVINDRNLKKKIVFILKKIIK